MGKGRSRRRKQKKRKFKQDAIRQLPEQEPPVSLVSDMLPDNMAIPLGGNLGVLVQSQNSDDDDCAKPNRTARRKAKRDKAKAKKRRGLLVGAASMVDPSLNPLPASASDELVDEINTSMSGEQHKPCQAGLAQSSTEEYLIAETATEPAHGAEPMPAALSHQPLPGDQPEIDITAIAGILDSEPARSESVARAAKNPRNAKEMTGEQPPWEVDYKGGQTALPRARALTDPNAKILTKLRHWMLRTFARSGSRAVATPADHSVDQLLSLQSDLAAVQQRLEDLIAGARK